MSKVIFKTIEECAVELVAHTRNDYGDMDRFPAQAARVSFANDKSGYTREEDTKLINYLAKHEHHTPFEYQHATLMIECPLFIRSQIHRHRTFSYNEISRRYTSDELAFWQPSAYRRQNTKNKQSSDAFAFTDRQLIDFDSLMIHHVERAMFIYNRYIEQGVAREQARAILPQSLLTRFYMGGNLRNWVHFLKLRLDAHAQYEGQVVARKCAKILYKLWPISIEALMGKQNG